MKELEEAFEKLQKAIYSCKTPPQLECALKLIEAFEAVFNNAHVSNEIKVASSVYRNELLKNYIEVENKIII